MLRTARARLPGRASILYESGRLAELFATDYALIGRVSMTSGARGQTVMLERIQQRRTGYLNDAAGWLRQAAALAPADDQLHVHLGRVLALSGNDDEAAAILTRATQSEDDATGYLAAMFLGGLRERQQRFDEAAAAYRAAIERFPRGHAGYIGLSELLQRGGHADEAAVALRELLKSGASPTREPLWWYQFEPPGTAEARLAALRKDVRH